MAIIAAQHIAAIIADNALQTAAYIKGVFA